LRRQNTLASSPWRPTPAKNPVLSASRIESVESAGLPKRFGYWST